MDHYAAERVAIEEQFASTWRETTAVRHENDAVAPTAGAEYAQISIKNGKPRTASLGNPPLRRCPGLVLVRLFVPQKVGSARLAELAGLAESAFQDPSTLIGRQLPSGENGLITFHEPPERSTGGPATGFFTQVVKFPFYRDQWGA